MDIHRTTTCSQHGHPELTIQMVEPSPIPTLHRILIDYFEAAVAGGSKFLPGQLVQIGWSTLRLCERSDGTIGVEERELTPDPAWTESVDRALHDVWLQREIAASVGMLEELAFPTQEEAVLVTECTVDAEAMLLTRLPVEDVPEGFSGWALSCAEDHEHGEQNLMPLLAIAANEPGLVQLLALPHGVSVLVLYREKPDAPEGALRIEPHIFRSGEEVMPEAGSYLAALQA